MKNGLGRFVGGLKLQLPQVSHPAGMGFLAGGALVLWGKK